MRCLRQPCWYKQLGELPLGRVELIGIMACLLRAQVRQRDPGKRAMRGQQCIGVRGRIQQLGSGERDAHHRAQQLIVKSMRPPARIVVGQQHQAGHRPRVLLENAVVVVEDAPRQRRVALRLDLDVDQHPLHAAIEQAYLNQLVGHHAVGCVAETDPGQFLVAETRPFGPIDLRTEFSKEEGHEIPEGMGQRQFPGQVVAGGGSGVWHTASLRVCHAGPH